MMKILRENMRRFRTKNLNEQVTPTETDSLIKMYKQLSDNQKSEVKKSNYIARMNRGINPAAVDKIVILIDKYDNKEITYDVLLKSLVPFVRMEFIHVHKRIDHIKSVFAN